MGEESLQTEVRSTDECHILSVVMEGAEYISDHDPTCSLATEIDFETCHSTGLLFLGDIAYCLLFKK